MFRAMILYYAETQCSCLSCDHSEHKRHLVSGGMQYNCQCLHSPGGRAVGAFFPYLRDDESYPVNTRLYRSVNNKYNTFIRARTSL